jgi:YD repeat-containing protein
MPSVLLRLTRLTAFLVILLCLPINGLCAASAVVFGPRDVTVGAWGVHISVQRFECAASGGGSLVVTRRTADKSFWGGFVLVNNRFFSLQEFLEGSQPVFAADLNLGKTNVIGVTVIGAPGATLGIEVRAKSGANLPQATFSASPETIALGQASLLQWTSTDAVSLSIAPDIGTVASSGSRSVFPQASTTYTLTASGPGGSVTRTARVTVIAPPPTVSFSVSPSSISAGETVVLAWSSTNAQSATIDPGIGAVLLPSGSLSTAPVATTTYTITASGAGGSVTASATVTVHTAPSVSISAASASIPLGASTSLSWNVAGAAAASIDQGLGPVALQGTATVSPTATTTYTITAAGPGGTAGAKVTVAVFGSPAPPPPGSFGETYQDQVPPDATVAAYDVKRFALLTGLVRDSLGGPLADVAVSIFDQPGYGTTATDADGRFTLPVEGGGILTVRFQKPGFIAAQRQVQVPWNDIAVVETVSLIFEDTAATVVKFDGSAATVVTHRSTEVTDARGTRAATLVFSGDNKAYLTDKAGNKTLELKTISARVTEYTTPESMPAKLPPSSAFTWCAEFSVDGAERIQFEKPVIAWVDNFLGFPVGAIVPVGYYDRDKARWLPMKNGRVVLLLDTDGDGIVDALDADGDGQPDDLDQNGSTRNEVLGLDDTLRYLAGRSYWRVAIKHFSPIDINWPFGIPLDAISANPTGAAVADVQQDASKEPLRCLGSFLEEKSRIFHEDIFIPGTDLRLHYTSSRTAGYKPGVITVPASGDSVPSSLIRIVVKAAVAGRSYEVTLPPEANQLARIEWDGLDHLGRPASGTITAYIQIGFVYYGVYYIAAGVGDAFGQPGLAPVTIPTRREVVSWKDLEVPIIRGIGTIAEGWSLSAHHYVNPMDPSRIFKGDGTIGTNNAAVIETVAGIGPGERVLSGLGGPAVKAQIGEPRGLATDEAGNLYIDTAVSAVYWNPHDFRFLKVDSNGVVTSVVQWPTAWPNLCARDAQGSLYQSYGSNCITKIHNPALYSPSDASTYTVYGDCSSPGYSGDGGPATAARFNAPKGIALDSSGNVYIADWSNHRVRKIDANGMITTFAGTGVAGDGGDGGPATAAAIRGPNCVAADGQGNIFIGERYLSAPRVRKVDPSGTITTVVGDGTGVFKGNGTLATETGLYDIHNIAVDKTGNLYILSYFENRVYKMDTSGIFSIVAGSVPNVGAFAGDGGAAAAARLNSPTAIAVGASGDIYIADSYNNRVRRVGPAAVRLSGLMDQSDIAFSEDNGEGYILSAAGRHKKTIDLATGVILRKFLYDTQDRLTAIVDAFGNQTVIERDAGGLPTAIVSADGIRTALTIDSANHLTRITHPDGSLYAFTYSSAGLELKKTEPAGNSFEHFYDSQGRLTGYSDDEGGRWQLTNSLLTNGDIQHEILTAEGARTMHVDRYAVSGTYQTTVTDATGAQSVMSESADGLTVASTLACGLTRESLYAIDPQFRFKYFKQLTEQSGTVLKRVTGFERVYSDTDADSIPDLIASKVTVNGRSSMLSQDIAAARKSLTSAEGRTLVVEYDPDTLVTERVQVPGLLDLNYTYDSRGRLTRVSSDTRQAAFFYDAHGNLAALTDSLGRQTRYEYDAVGRVTGVTRPDGSFVDFAHDANGNLTVLVNPSGVAHRFAYNKVNRASGYTTPLSGSYQYRYDRDRRPTETVLPSGRVIRNVYDQGRLLRTETPEGDVYFDYLCGSKPGSIIKSGEGINYIYDGSLLTAETASGSLNQAVS